MELTSLAINSTLRLMLDEVTFVALDEADNEFQNTGTCTFTLTEIESDREVDSGTVSYVTASDGKYVVEIGPYPEAADREDPQAGEIIRGKRYSLLVNFVQDGEECTKELKLKAVYQT